MRNIEISRRSLEDIVKASLEDDLEMLEQQLEEGKYFDGFAFKDAVYKRNKKDIKALKRVINFYSVEPPYVDF